MKPNRTVIAVVGPTASGKTALAVRLAQALDTEIISCDSMQLYDGMRIGTARPTEDEMCGVKHHMLAVCDPLHPFSCADYAAMAGDIADGLLERGKIPLFCGGTGLYLDSVLKGRHFDETVGSTEIRAALTAEYEKNGIGTLFERLREVDPESAAAIHPNNAKRVIRALEIFDATGKTKTAWDAESRRVPNRYDALILGLSFTDRAVLNARIDRRVDAMMEAGLLDEVKALLKAGLLSASSTAGQAIGYKELLAYLRGDCTLDEAVQQIKTATRQYAKRQMTYFNRTADIVWLHPDETDADGLCAAALALVREHIK